MDNKEIDRAFERGPALPSEVAAQIRARILRDTTPVKPLPGEFALGLSIAALLLAVAVAFAFLAGIKGLHALSVAAAAAFLIPLALLGFTSAKMAARSMRPASGNLHILPLAALAFTLYEALVLGFFRDYETTLFIHNGLACLSLGVLCGALTAFPVWIIVRRGFIVQGPTAGALIGLVGGLAGLFALTMHCPVLTTPHAGIWHAASLIICVAAGTLLGRRIK